MDISRGNEDGQWLPVNLDGIKTATLKCPKGHFGYLDHDIDDEGVVTPSVQCSGNQNETCDFHESVRLIGWKE